jgi:hypothetical protein
MEAEKSVDLTKICKRKEAIQLLEGLNLSLSKGGLYCSRASFFDASAVGSLSTIREGQEHSDTHHS